MAYLLYLNDQVLNDVNSKILLTIANTYPIVKFSFTLMVGLGFYAMHAVKLSIQYKPTSTRRQTRVNNRDGSPAVLIYC